MNIESYGTAETAWWIAYAVVVAVATILIWARSRHRRVIRLGNISWAREDWLRGFLITGDTGSGKNRSGLHQLFIQWLKNEPKAGGLILDDKGVIWEPFLGMAKRVGRENDVVLLGNPGQTEPIHRLNLIGDRSIPATSYASMVIDTALALGQNRSGNNAFFFEQARIHISKAIETLEELSYDITLDNVYQLLVDDCDLSEAIKHLEARRTPKSQALAKHFSQQYRCGAPEQFAGTRGAIANILEPYTAPEVASVFCCDSTFAIGDLDHGKQIVLALPHRLITERRFVASMLKQLTYHHILNRFSRPQSARAKMNQVVIWMDEAHQFVTASERGVSDYAVIDRIREARAGAVLTSQSSTSFIPALGKDKAKVLLLNLRNRIVFKAADQEDAVATADFIGKRKHSKVTWTMGKGGRSRTVTEEDVYRIKPDELRGLRKHECVVVHCEGKSKKMTLVPLEPDGSVSPWFPWWRGWFG